MPRNVYFSQGTTPEKRLYEDITIEALKIYGHDAYYIPRTIVNTDSIFNEDALSKFGEAFQIEMYLENTDGFEGDGDLLSKFGVEIRDSMTMVLATRRWEELIGRFQSPAEARPQEGDLIYFPLVKGLFQITYVEDDNPFYQLSNLPTFKLTCELFEYGNEAIDTGIAEVDDFETKYASRTKLTLDNGSGTYTRGEDVTQINGSLTITGEVSVVGTGEIDVSSAVASDGTNTGFAITAGSVGNVIGSDSGASYEVTAIGGFNEIDDNDPYAENIDFETIGNNFIDFTETNPFGEPDITS